MTGLWIRNDDLARVLVVRVWHPSNPFMSDGDSAWLDENGAQTGKRSHDRTLLPGQSLVFAAQGELAITVFADGAVDAKGIVDSVWRYFRTGSTASGHGTGAAPFSLTNEAAVPLRVRLFASAAFQFSPLQELSLAPGETVALSTGKDAVSVRLG